MPANNKLLDLSKNIATDDPKFIDLVFNELLSEIKQCPKVNTLNLKANHLVNKHLPLLEQALSNHSSIIELSLAYNTFTDRDPDLGTFLLFLVTKNPNIEEISLSSCNIDDNEFKNIIETLWPTGALSRVYIDFSRNDITSKSADLAIRHKVNDKTLNFLKFNNDLTDGNENIRNVINEVLKGKTAKKSQILTAYFEALGKQDCSAEVNKLSSDVKNLKLIK